MTVAAVAAPSASSHHHHPFPFQAPLRRAFLGFRFKQKDGSPKQSYGQPASRPSASLLHLSILPPPMACNPAIYPLINKPVAREENFVLLPSRSAAIKRKRDPNSPTRPTSKPRGTEPSTGEWTRYLSSYAEGRFNLSNPPEPPAERPEGHMKAPIPSNDAERIKALRQYYDVLKPDEESPPSVSPTSRSQIDRFQRLVITARQTFDTKVVLLSLVDEKRQFYKCEVGLGMKVETDRDITFCGHTILSNEPMVVLDAQKDWRLAGNPLVTGWPYVRFYAGAPIITKKGYAIGTICIIDTQPRDSFDVNQRRKLAEFARLAMDEIDLAMRTRRAKNRKEALAKLDPSASVPSELRGMTAVASEGGMINAVRADRDLKRAIKALDDFDVVETAVTMTAKGGDGEPIKFRYGRNDTPGIEASAKGVENATRRGTVRRVQIQRPQDQRPVHAQVVRIKRPETALSARQYREFDGQRGYSSDSDIKPPTVRPKSALRTVSYGLSSPAGSPTKITATPNKEYFDNDASTSSLEHHPPTSKDETDRKSMIPRTPAMPSEAELQTKSNPELACQLIARALRVDFVYFMRLSPVTATSTNRTSDPASEINMEILGCFGLPYPELNFKPEIHLEALRSESGVQYDNTGDGDESMLNHKDYFRLGMVVPVWREFPTSLSRAGTVTESVTSSTKAQVGSASEVDCRPGSSSSAGRRRSWGASSASTSTTVRRMREGCRAGVVVGVFSKKMDRNTFTTVEKEYLKEWISLKDHV